MIPSLPIDDECLKFADDLRQGRSSGIEQYLAACENQASAELVEQLCQVEIEHALRAGRTVHENQLRKRLPDHREAVSAAFTSLRAKYPQHADRLIPDPAKSDPGLLDVFFKSTNILAPAAFLDTDDFSDVEVLEPEVQLKVIKGPHAGKELTYRKPVSVLVGRSNDAHLQLIDDEKCSRLHCRFEINPPACSLIDLKSTNGTLVNAEPVERCALNDGDTVQAGRTRIRVHIQDCRSPSLAGDHSLGVETYDPSRHAPILPGYEVGRLIGKGRFGVVYAGRHLSSGRKVALKFLSRSAVPSGNEVQQFIREASISVKLRHPRIVETLDFGVHDEMPYLVFEYVDTIDMTDELKSLSKPVRYRVCADLAAQMLEGLHYAHTQDVIHRDIKLSNLLFYRDDQDYRVKIADFGLALRTVEASRSERAVCGTAAYMAPEIILDPNKAGPRSEVYAAAVCLYQLICGRRPHEAKRLSKMVFMVLNEPPTPIRERDCDVPPDLAEIIGRAIARRPRERFRDAAAMRDALLAFLTAET